MITVIRSKIIIKIHIINYGNKAFISVFILRWICGDVIAQYAQYCSYRLYWPTYI